LNFVSCEEKEATYIKVIGTDFTEVSAAKLNITIGGVYKLYKNGKVKMIQNDKKQLIEDIEEKVDIKWLKVDSIYDVNDVVNMSGILFEVEEVTDKGVVLSHEDGPEFAVELEYIKLVCKAKDRQDLDD
jgi:hypothetical protein